MLMRYCLKLSNIYTEAMHGKSGLNDKGNVKAIEAI